MPRVFDLSVAADLENLSSVRAFVRHTGESLGMDETTLGDLCLVVDEAVTNVIVHGYEGKPGTVDLSIEPDGGDLIIRIRDRARPFQPVAVEQPHLDESLDQRPYGGMGVYLIRKMTDEAEFSPLPDGGNELRMVKRGVVGSPPPSDALSG